MNKVKCNNCDNVFNEEEIVYKREEYKEFCPNCGKNGYLMDIEDLKGE